MRRIYQINLYVDILLFYPEIHMMDWKKNHLLAMTILHSITTIRIRLLTLMYSLTRIPVLVLKYHHPECDFLVILWRLKIMWWIRTAWIECNQVTQICNFIRKKIKYKSLKMMNDILIWTHQYYFGVGVHSSTLINIKIVQAIFSKGSL